MAAVGMSERRSNAVGGGLDDEPCGWEGSGNPPRFGQRASDGGQRPTFHAANSASTMGGGNSNAARRQTSNAANLVSREGGGLGMRGRYVAEYSAACRGGRPEGRAARPKQCPGKSWVRNHRRISK